MSETKSRFKMKKGDIEIEYEGVSEEVSSKFTEIFDWLKSEPVIHTQTKPNNNVTDPPQAIKQQNQVQKQGKGGGSRSAVVAPALNEILNDGFLNDFKSLDQILEELKRRAVPSNLKSVRSAIVRKVPKTVDRVKDGDTWVYRKKPSAG